ncbi:MAG TPA: hypothetical protein VJC08_00670 [bacterium]|nr:hypothetical protein [bacterium]
MTAKKNQVFLGILPAAIPLLSRTNDWHGAFLQGALVAFAFWATGFFFSFTRSFFPRRFAMFALLLWSLTLAQCGRYFGLEPFWILSVLLLLPFEWVKRGPRYFPKEPADFFCIRQGIGFWAFLVCLAIAQELLEKRLGLLIFLEPAGSWLLIGAALLLWPGLSGSIHSAPPAEVSAP